MKNSHAHPNLFGLATVILIAQTPSECLFGDPYLPMFQIHFIYIVKNIFFDNYIQGLRWDFMVANNLCKINYIKIRI